MCGNCGIFIQGFYELQIFDSYNSNNPIYSNGQCGSMYNHYMPLINVCKKVGEWQVFDIIFKAPQFNLESTLKEKA